MRTQKLDYQYSIGSQPLIIRLGMHIHRQKENCDGSDSFWPANCLLNDIFKDSYQQYSPPPPARQKEVGSKITKMIEIMLLEVGIDNYD